MKQTILVVLLALACAKGYCDDFYIQATPTSNSVAGVNGCPGKYNGTSQYSKFPIGVFGWRPSTNTTIHTITDTNRTDTHIVALGKFSNSFCDQTTVAITNNFNEPYRFTVYFPTNTIVPTNTYWIHLSGFDP